MNVKEWRENVSVRILESLSNGTAPWLTPWKSKDGLPINATTEKPYKGVNAVCLLMETLISGGDPRFLTFKQTLAKKWKVKKGAKGIPILKMVNLSKSPKPPVNEEEEEEEENSRKGNLIPMVYHVFNACDVEGIPSAEDKDILPVDLSTVPDMLSRLGVKISKGDTLMYKEDIDTIYVPGEIDSQEKLGALLLVEISATGTKSRLGWHEKFQSKEMQELILGFAGMFLSRITGVPLPKEHFSPLKDNAQKVARSISGGSSFSLFQAISAAQHATDWVVMHSQI